MESFRETTRLLKKQGKLDEAIAKCWILAQKQEKFFGFESRLYMESFHEITRLLEMQGKLDEAIAKWGVLAQNQEKFFGFESRTYMESFREITRLHEERAMLVAEPDRDAPSPTQDWGATVRDTLKLDVWEKVKAVALTLVQKYTGEGV
uniref:Uncharacterized protein n=1 Tax=Chromera velia CCMP2878 TaxID=1169474 RepID=A0A0G4HBB2_9ALVE|eukprot:Cvel_6178.t1-p1 / transcript=Cvel_6178.t1 / gene=Cvel_6178 / organism=Chromera_velia_CCMP2878 / gene_product=hypothetical protein / transcript_product=hypothetical protein / location=Cvel_scaffold299:36775-37218(-) / protein_length=148 / sequence_SO=supercontig / SO=protein_coding / is_pseudo=false